MAYVNVSSPFEVADIVNFDASRSNAIYGNSNTVQPQTIRGLVYIVVGTSAKPEAEVDIDRIATDLNGKTDVDLSNVSDTGRGVMAHMGMPDPGRTVELTVSREGQTFRAPVDGYFHVSIGPYAATGTTGYVRLTHCFGADEMDTPSDQRYSVQTDNTCTQGGYNGLILPIPKGHYCFLGFNATSISIIHRFVFIPCKGAK